MTTGTLRHIGPAILLLPVLGLAQPARRSPSAPLTALQIQQLLVDLTVSGESGRTPPVERLDAYRRRSREIEATEPRLAWDERKQSLRGELMQEVTGARRELPLTPELAPLWLWTAWPTQAKVEEVRREPSPNGPTLTRAFVRLTYPNAELAPRVKDEAQPLHRVVQSVLLELQLLDGFLAGASYLPAYTRMFPGLRPAVVMIAMTGTSILLSAAASPDRPVERYNVRVDEYALDARATGAFSEADVSAQLPAEVMASARSRAMWLFVTLRHGGVDSSVVAVPFEYSPQGDMRCYLDSSLLSGKPRVRLGSGPCTGAATPLALPRSDFWTTIQANAAVTSGSWTGRYSCGERSLGMSLSLTRATGDSLSGMLEFYPLATDASQPRGSFAVAGRVDPAGLIALKGVKWLDQPPQWTMLTLFGAQTRNGLELRIPECATQTTLRRQP